MTIGLIEALLVLLWVRFTGVLLQTWLKAKERVSWWECWRGAGRDGLAYNVSPSASVSLPDSSIEDSTETEQDSLVFLELSSLSSAVLSNVVLLTALKGSVRDFPAQGDGLVQSFADLGLLNKRVIKMTEL